MGHGERDLDRQERVHTCPCGCRGCRSTLEAVCNQGYGRVKVNLVLQQLVEELQAGKNLLGPVECFLCSPSSFVPQSDSTGPNLRAVSSVSSTWD